MNVDPAIVSRLEAVPLFTRCGVSEPVAVPWPSRQAVDAAQVAAGLTDPSWEEAELEARNVLTAWLALRFSRDYAEWNKITAVLAPEVTRIVDAPCHALMAAHGLPPRLVHGVHWDLLRAGMELAYARKGLPRHGLDLLAVYEAGHLPCGWTGTWPRGTLLYW